MKNMVVAVLWFRVILLPQDQNKLLFFDAIHLGCIRKIYKRMSQPLFMNWSLTESKSCSNTVTLNTPAVYQRMVEAEDFFLFSNGKFSP